MTEHFDYITIAAESLFKGDPVVEWRGRWYRGSTAPWLGGCGVSVVNTAPLNPGIVVRCPDFPMVPDIDWDTQDPFRSEGPDLGRLTHERQ